MIWDSGGGGWGWWWVYNLINGDGDRGEGYVIWSGGGGGGGGWDVYNIINGDGDGGEGYAIWDGGSRVGEGGAVQSNQFEKAIIIGKFGACYSGNVSPPPPPPCQLVDRALCLFRPLSGSVAFLVCYSAAVNASDND